MILRRKLPACRWNVDQSSAWTRNCRPFNGGGAPRSQQSFRPRRYGSSRYSDCALLDRGFGFRGYRSNYAAARLADADSAVVVKADGLAAGKGVVVARARGVEAEQACKT